MSSKSKILAQFIDKKYLKHITIALAGIAVITVMLLSYFKEEAVFADTYTVGKGDFNIVLSEAAEIQAVQAIDIAVPSFGGSRRGGSSSQPLTFLIPEGTMVTKGDTIAQFDLTEFITERDDLLEELTTVKNDLAREIELQESQVSLADKNMQNAIFALQTAKLDMELAKFESEVTKKEMQLQYQIAKIESSKVAVTNQAARVTRDFNLSKARKEIREVQNDLDLINMKIDAYTIAAPIDGMVVLVKTGWPVPKKVQEGDSPWGGMPFMQIPDLSKLRASIYVNDMERENVFMGQEGVLKLESYPDDIFTGKINVIANLSQGAKQEGYSNVKVFEVQLLIDNADEKLRPGMSAEVDLIMESVSDVLVVPLSSVYELDGVPIVFLANGDKRGITVGRKNESMIEVVEGLSEGDEILVKAPLGENVNKLGFSLELARREKEINQLQEHFAEIEDMGIRYDYDENRGKPMQRENRRGMRGGGELSDDQIKKMLEARGMEATPEAIERTKEFLKNRGNRGGRQRGELNRGQRGQRGGREGQAPQQRGRESGDKEKGGKPGGNGGN